MSRAISILTSYGKVDPNVLADPEISAQAKGLYSLLCCYADPSGYCFPSNPTLAEQMGVNERSINRWKAELAEKKIIRIWSNKKKAYIDVQDASKKHWHK